MSKFKNRIAQLKKRICTIRSYYDRKIIGFLITRAKLKDTKRNKVVIFDFFLEEDTSPQDGYELFQYIYRIEDSSFEPYYIMNANSSRYTELRSKYNDYIIPYSKDHHIRFAFHLKNLLKTTRFIETANSFEMGFYIIH